jgi:SET domain-containing protein
MSIYEDENIIVAPSPIEGFGIFTKRTFKKGEVVMQIPERYVNHSDNPNTEVIDDTDVALKDINIGEEITSNYPL